jgi:hypothetical protein
LGVGKLPTASTTMRTRTPQQARSTRAARKRSPIALGWKMKASMWTLCVAAAIAAS